MLLRFTHYITALIFLTASSVIYENVISPWMQPPVVTAIPLREDFETRGNPSLVELFPDGSWQRGTCKQLESSNGMLLFASWKQISDDQWKLWPVTIVVGRGMSGETSEDPVIIDAPEGAEIIFTESLDVMSGGAPPIHRGRMIGPVHIRRPNSKKENQALSIRTANVGIDNRKIWTTESIEMNVGDARMMGRDLTIHFAGAGNNAMVLDRMELIYLDELIMPLETSGLKNSGKEAVAQCSLQCGGRVEYDFALNQLSLRDSVSLIYQVGDSLADYFRCDSLLLKLRDPTNSKLRRESPIDWLDKIVATGSPARAVLPTFDAELTANSIEFDSIAGLVQANGKTGVQVKRGGIEATVAQLAYQFDPKRPNMIGAIDVQGAGIVSVDDPEIPILRAHWRDSFKLQPTSLTTTDNLNSNFEVFIDGDLRATLSDGGKFKADNIEGVLKAKSTVGADQKAVTTFTPDWFKANGDVHIDTSAIAAQTQQLLLFFVDPAVEPVAKSVADPPQDSNPLRQWVIQPGSGESTVDPIARPRPVIRGDEISAKLLVDQTGVSAKDLSVTGSVLLTHMLQAGGQMLPAKLTGEELRLIDGGGGNDVLQLGSGTAAPARFELGDGFFVGPMIQIWPSENVIRINESGEFQMPTAALPTSLSGDPDSNIQWKSAPHCRWQGEMIFNGRSAVLTEGVEINATLLQDGQQWDLLMRGDQLQVDLQQNVTVSDMQTMKNAAIQRVTLSQSGERPVIVRALRRAGDGILEAKHLLQAAKLTLIPGGGSLPPDANSIASGKLIGQGPGWYRGWMIPPAKNPLTPMAKTTPKPDDRRRLSGIHLIFSDSMQGDLVNQSLEFLRGVRVGVRPVDDWDEVFDAAAMDAISLGDSTIDCDRLQFTVAPGAVGRFHRAPTPWEMEATSGVVFRTRTDRGLLEGTASRAAYSSGKDLFTVEGAPNRAAIFRQTLPNGQKGPEGAVKTMTLRPSTMEVQNMQLERLNIATPPSLGKR